MKILHLNNARTSILKEIAKQLKAGAVLVYPTDTAYGLGCDATNAQAVAKIFKIKGRASAKGLPMIVADAKMAKKFFLLTTNHLSLTTKFWPGPLSIILKAKGMIVKAALEAGTAAVRVPDSAIARQLARFLGRPLTATSANLTGAPTCYSAKAYLKQADADRLPDLVIDAGALPRRKPSTIVRVGKSGTIEVLRKGPVKL